MIRFFQRISRPGLMMIAAGVLLLVLSAADFQTSFRKAKSFEDVVADGGLEPGDHLEGQVPLLLDSFAYEETWTEDTSKNSRTPKKTSHYYYVLPCGETMAGLTIGTSNMDAAAELADQTYGYFSGGAEPSAELVLQARVVEMDGELADMFAEELQDYYDFTNSEISRMKPFLMIEPRNFLAVRGLFAAGAALLVFGALIFVRRWRKYGEAAAEAF